MPSLADQIPINGGLDFDNDPTKVQGDYTDALDISHIGNNGTTNAIVNITRNQLAFQMGSVGTQNKKYRVTYATTGTNQITVYRTDKVTELLPAINFTSTNPAATIIGAFAASGLAAIVTENLAENYVEIEYTGLAIFATDFYEYWISNTGSSTMTIQVLQEAIDQSLVGELNVIGSWDKLGDLFIHSTSQRNLPTVIDAQITNIGFASPLPVTTDVAHGLTTGESISISGVLGLTNANGVHVVNVTGATTFEIYNVTAGPNFYTSGGTITTNATGIGEIGVATKNLNTDTWTYTRLIRSKQLNFVTRHQHDIRVEETNFQNNDYFTDDYNAPRVFQYKGAYILDGALTVNNAEGIYDYDSVDAEMQLLLSQAGVQISYTSQSQGGGSLKSGNKRYAVRLLTENLSATVPTDLTNPVPVYNASFTGDVNQILGDAPGTTTGKINRLTATGLIQDLFKYVELLVVEYTDGAVTASIVKREEITSSTMELTHTGSEVAIAFDAAQFNDVGTNLATAKSIEIIDNRLTLSNLTQFADKDLTAWAQTFNHSILRKEIDEFITGVQAGEYQDPDNVARNMGYMINETYRFGVKVRWKKTGDWSRAYHIQDIIIDTDPTVIRRVSALPDNNLNNSANNTVYVPYVEFSNIDFGTLVDGIPLVDLIDEIAFVRAEVVNKTILMSGIGVLGVSALPGNIDSVAVNTNYVLESDSNVVGEEVIFDYPFISGFNNTNYDPITVTYAPPLIALNDPVYPNPINNGATTGFTAAKRDFVSLYSPDLLTTNEAISFQTGDQIFTFGAPSVNLSRREVEDGASYSYYREYKHENLTPQVPHNIDAVRNIPMFDEQSFGTDRYLKSINASTSISTTNTQAWGIQGSVVVNTQTGLLNNNTNTEYGVHAVQYRRPQANQYGDVDSQIYVTTGASYSVSSLSLTVGTGVIEVFGGDSFTQSTIMKHMYINSANTWVFTIAGTNLGLGVGVKFYGQNRVNSQLRYDTDSQFLFPKDTQRTQIWLEETNDLADEWTYDRGYNIDNQVQETVAFDPNATLITDLKARLIYSQNKPQNSFVDQYRTFLPLNFHDEDSSFGEITSHHNVNGELFTLQPRKWKIQSFNTRATLNTVDNASEIIIGSGSVFTAEGQTLSTYGCSNKWSIIQGRSQGGSDTLYWVNAEHKMVMRFGRDGTNTISDRANMRSWFLNNLTWVDGKDNPAHDEGIEGFWDSRHKEAVWVVRGRRTVNLWTTGTNYTNKGEYVQSGTSTFNETPDIYQLLTPNTSSAATQPGVGADWQTYWQLVPHTSNTAYNEYSVAWNEYKNKFTSFFSILPKIVLQWKDTFLSPRPISQVDKVYEHDLGTLGVTYDTNKVDGFFEMLYNKDDVTRKRWLATMLATDIQPFRGDFKTDTQQTFLLTSDFEEEGEQFFGAIKNDSTTSGDPNGDTSFLYGTYIKEKVTFEKERSQKLTSATIKFAPLARNARK